jgi:hypothetical protein
MSAPPSIDELRARVGREPDVLTTARIDETSVRRLCEVFGVADFPPSQAIPWTWLPYLVRPRPRVLDDERPTPELGGLGSVVNGGTRAVPHRQVFIGDELTLAEGLHSVEVKQRGDRVLTIVTTRQLLTRQAKPCVDYYRTAVYRGTSAS